MGTKPSPSGGGFYAGIFLPGELEDLTQAMELNLTDEIDMLRVLMRRVFNRLIEDSDDLKTWVGALNVLSAATQRLATLVRAQKQLGEDRTGVAGSISQALGELLQEMRAE
jgi:hypothetical protein